MKIADYGKAITSYIESPTKFQKDITKKRASDIFEDRAFLSEGTIVPIPPKKPRQLKDLFERIDRTVAAIRSKTMDAEFLLPGLEEFTQEYIKDGLISGSKAREFAIERKEYYDNFIKNNPSGTLPSFDFDNDGKETQLTEEEIIERINQADGGTVERKDFQSGTNVLTLNPLFPEKNTDIMSKEFKPLDVPGAIIPPLAIGAAAKRIKDTFFSKDKDEEKKDIQPSDDKNNLIKGDGPEEPDPLDDLQNSIEIAEAVNRLKKKEMDPGKRDSRTRLARDLDLPVTRSGMLEVRKGDYFNKRLQTLKDKGVNFEGYFSIPEIANLIGSKSSSGIQSYIQDKNIPTVKKGLFKVVKLNDFLDVYQGTKKRVDLTPPLTLQNLARKDFLDEDNRSQLFERFKRIKFGTDLKDPTKEIPAEIRSIYNKYDLSKIEGGHPFPVEFFTKKFGKKGTLQKERQFDWIYRNKDKLFNPNDLVLQSKDINAEGGPFFQAIKKLKPLYKELGQYVDKYEGKGAVKNKEDVEKISKLNLEVMKIIKNSKGEVEKFMEDNPDSKLTIPKMKTGGLHGAVFDYETGEVELYAPDKQVLFESGAVGDKPEDQKLKIAEGFLDVLNQVIDDKSDLKTLTDYFEGKVLPRFKKGGPVYGKYAKQIAGLS